MASTPGFEPGPHWWEASALSTAPPLLPKYHQGCHRPGNDQGKISSRSGKSQGISVRVKENLSLGKKSGKTEILRVHIHYFFFTVNVFRHLKFICTLYGHESCCICRILLIKLNWVFKKINPFCT